MHRLSASDSILCERMKAMYMMFVKGRVLMRGVCTKKRDTNLKLYSKTLVIHITDGVKFDRIRIPNVSQPKYLVYNAQNTGCSECVAMPLQMTSMHALYP